MRASSGEVGDGESSGVPGTGDRAGASRSGRDSEPALDNEVMVVGGKAEDLVDPPPGPVVRSTEESPELPRSGGGGVPRPGLRDGGERGEGEFREQ